LTVGVLPSTLPPPKREKATG